MASSKYDLRQNVDAVTDFLEALNSPDETSSSQSSGAPSISQAASDAAVDLLRLLGEREVVPLDEAISANDSPFLDVTEAISRLGKAGAVESREVEGKEELFLTEHGQHLARAVSQGTLAS